MLRGVDLGAPVIMAIANETTLFVGAPVTVIKRKRARSMLSDYDRANIGNLIAGKGNWFTAKLLRLCAEADPQNLERLRKGFPEEVRAYLEWRDGPATT